MGHGSDDHKGRSYKIRMMKRGFIITQMKRCEVHPSISGGLPQERDVKPNRPQADDIGNFASLNLHKHLNDLEMEGKDIMPKRTQPPKHTLTDHLGEIKQRGKRISEDSTHKHILKKLST